MRLLVLSVCVVAAMAAPLDQWEAFKAAQGKGYLSSGDEQQYRYAIREGGMITVDVKRLANAAGTTNNLKQFCIKNIMLRIMSK